MYCYIKTSDHMVTRLVSRETAISNVANCWRDTRGQSQLLSGNKTLKPPRSCLVLQNHGLGKYRGTPGLWSPLGLGLLIQYRWRVTPRRPAKVSALAAGSLELSVQGCGEK